MKTEGTHTLKQLKALKGFKMDNTGNIITKEGIITHYWQERQNKKYLNTHDRIL